MLIALPQSGHIALVSRRRVLSVSSRANEKNIWLEDYATTIDLYIIR